MPGPVTFPLKTVRDIQIDEDLREASARLEQTDPFVDGELLELADENLPPDDEGDGAKTPTAYGHFSQFYVCFCGLDLGSLKFETVRTHRQYICS